MTKKWFDWMIIFVIGCFILVGCTKDEILKTYNDTLQIAGSSLITCDTLLNGSKSNGIDEYTGDYQADYTKFSGIEYLFGGTSIERAAGKEIEITCTLDTTTGTANVFWISGSEEPKTLLETDGTYTETITLPDGGNYIGVACENFTGSLDLCIK